MTMKNVGWRDAGIRAFIGSAFLLAAASLQKDPLLALAAGSMAIVFLGTALYQVCPLYTILRINTWSRDLTTR